MRRRTPLELTGTVAQLQTCCSDGYRRRVHVNVQKENSSSINGIEFLGEKKVDGQLFLFGKKAPVVSLLLVLIARLLFCVSTELLNTAGS